MTEGHVLLVEDDPSVREALSQTMELAGYHVIEAGSFVAAKDRITEHFEGVILSDIRMPGRDGLYLLDYVQKVDTELPVILLTGEGDIPTAVQAMNSGAFDFLEKPCAPAALVAVMERALHNRRLVLENRALKTQLETGDPAARLIFGRSRLADELRARVRVAARAGTGVLVSGPQGSGVGKVAEVVHLCSARSKGPFEKRAGSALRRSDLSELAHTCAGGTLFVDEVGLTPTDTQLTLNDMLETGDLMVVAGTTRDLAPLVDAGAFNADLFYRLDVMQVRIPALSERPEDIPVLFRQYAAQAAEQAGIAVPEISEDYLAILVSRDWPGNTRSLMSAAMRFVLGMPEDVVRAEELGLAEQMAQVERALLIAALGRSNGHASDAAKRLKLPRKTFYDKLARYGIKPEDYRR